MQDLSAQISSLRKRKWVNLNGLVSLATTRLSKIHCVSISLLGRGSYNTVYKLDFSDSTTLAASVSNEDEEDFDPVSKWSEISTILFVRESTLYPDIPVPQLHAWDLTFANPAGAPYIFMDVIKGRQLNDIDNGSGLKGLDAMTPEEQLLVVERLAALQASLLKPVSFQNIGSLSRSDHGDTAVGELVTFTGQRLGGPYRTLPELWYALLERETLKALREWSHLETDDFPDSTWGGTPEKFSRLLQQLSALIPHFVPPSPYLSLVLHHPDLALRNVLVDPDDLTKITGVIDWGGSQIVPIMLAAHFPSDLMSEGDEPCERPGHPDEGWNTVPHDWTSFGDVSAWPQVFGAHHEPVDLTVRASAMVRRYYLRQYFSTCYTRARASAQWSQDIATRTVFADAPYYLKFHEVLIGGTESWFRHQAWIEETFWRMKMMPSNDDSALIIGPNHYRFSVEKLVCDLGIFERDQSSNDPEGPGDIEGE